MDALTRTYPGDRGFHLLATDRLSEALRRYQKIKKLNREARDQALRDHACACVREIHQKIARRHDTEAAA